MINWKDFVDWTSVALVVISGALTGHYASLGMNALQWAGAAAAVLGSITVAVAVRCWPPAVKANTPQRD
jgi:uncharacterized membrane protein